MMSPELGTPPELRHNRNRGAIGYAIVLTAIGYILTMADNATHAFLRGALNDTIENIEGLLNKKAGNAPPHRIQTLSCLDDGARHRVIRGSVG